MNQAERDKYPFVHIAMLILLGLFMVFLASYGGGCLTDYMRSKITNTEPPAVSKAEPSR